MCDYYVVYFLSPENEDKTITRVISFGVPFHNILLVQRPHLINTIFSITTVGSR